MQAQRLPQALLVSNQANRERLGIARKSFSFLPPGNLADDGGVDEFDFRLSVFQHRFDSRVCASLKSRLHIFMPASGSASLAYYNTHI